MYKLGNLAIICAERGDVSLTISKGVITLDIHEKRIDMDWSFPIKSQMINENKFW